MISSCPEESKTPIKSGPARYRKSSMVARRRETTFDVVSRQTLKNERWQILAANVS